MNAYFRKRWNRVANAAIAAALILAALPAGMRAYGDWTQAAARSQFTPALPPSAKPAASPGPLVRDPPARKWQTSVLEIPSIGVNAVVDEGTGNWRLMPGPGHEPGTAGAGGRGNCIIAAHRNMWESTFAHLPRIQPGDEITLTTSDGIFTYRAVSSRQVSTKQRSVLAPTKTARLTLYTCVIPFKESRRWVVQARLSDAWVQSASSHPTR